MAARNYTNFAPQQTIQSGLSSASTSVVVASFSSWPSAPFYAVLEYGTANAEVVLVTAIVGTTATVTRGADGSVAVGHLTGSTFDHATVAQDLRDTNVHVNASAGVHGVSGAVVGTSDAQTLSNKTLAGTTNAANVTASGTVQAATVTATGAVNAATATISGALSAGAASVASVAATGAVNGGSGTITGTLSAGALSASGAVTAGGAVNGATANITGAAVAGSFNTNGTIFGVLSPRTFTNEAAAGTAGFGNAGAVCYFTAPNSQPGFTPGVYICNGSVWIPIANDSGWVVPSLGNSWVSFDGGATYDVPMYRKQNSMVSVKGMMKSGTTGGVAFTLPAGIRPALRKKFTVPASGGTAELNILATGDVVVSSYSGGGTNAYVSLDVNFMAEG